MPNHPKQNRLQISQRIALDQKHSPGPYKAAVPLHLACFFSKKQEFASYRAAGANAGSELRPKGPAEVPETRKLYGTQ